MFIYQFCYVIWTLWRLKSALIQLFRQQFVGAINKETPKLYTTGLLTVTHRWAVDWLNDTIASHLLPIRTHNGQRSSLPLVYMHIFTWSKCDVLYTYKNISLVLKKKNESGIAWNFETNTNLAP